MRLDSASPFVLFDDARPGAAPARLYRAPVRIVSAARNDAVLPALEEIRAGRAAGLHAAGYLAYEAGAAFETRLKPPAETGAPLLWFGLFEGYDEIAPSDVAGLLPDPAGCWIGAPEPEIDRAAYEERLERVLALIAAGDIYQANLTYRAIARFAGNPLALYAQLRPQASAGYGAIVSTGAELFLSFSPELFFSLEAGALTARPMKGTVRRGATAVEDSALAEALSTDAKQRAENLMIVDLMRNDLTRIARPGSVAVPELFTVETYPTLHQMVSTVTADLAPDSDAIDVLSALFPCGSITGAPKIRAMEVIAGVETGAPRGVYTGAIGRVDADGDAMFNVAIRTLSIRAGESKAMFGAGGGIVADSRAEEEWDEARAKGAFLTAGTRRFDLIETMAFDPEQGLPLLERHLERMKASADLFGFAFDRHGTRNELQAATFRLRAPGRVRLVLARSGAIAISVSPMPVAPAGPVNVAIVPLPVDRQDFRLSHKTSDRGFYDAARGSHFEVAFTDPEGFLTEGSFTSLFVERGGALVTPPLARGLLPGVLRADLIARGRAVEGDLTPADLRGGFFVGNALRGLIPAIVAVANGSGPGL